MKTAPEMFLFREDALSKKMPNICHTQQSSLEQNTVTHTLVWRASQDQTERGVARKRQNACTYVEHTVICTRVTSLDARARPCKTRHELRAHTTTYNATLLQIKSRQI